jgi:ABC-2 type transport system permease protein
MTMNSLTHLVRFSLALTSINIRATLALRGAFLLQAALMLVNNVTFFATWVIFFDRFEQIGGWRIEDVGVVFGVVALGFGLAHVAGGGAPHLSRMILAGDLDSVLVQPKHPLVQLVAARSSAAAWGDMATGVAFLAVAGRLDSFGGPLLVLATFACALAFMAVITVFHCAAFWLGRVDALAAMLSDFTLTFSLYPRTLFGGSVRILLYSVIPAALVGWYPAEAVREPALAPIAGMLISSFGLVALAFVVFHFGVKRYESGSRFGMSG